MDCESGRQDSNLRPLIPQISLHFPMSAEFDLDWFCGELVGTTTRACSLEHVEIGSTMVIGSTMISGGDGSLGRRNAHTQGFPRFPGRLRLSDSSTEGPQSDRTGGRGGYLVTVDFGPKRAPHGLMGAPSPSRRLMCSSARLKR
jgi:hypothetical protein